MANTLVTNVTGLLDVEAMVKNLTSAKQKQIKKLAENKALAQAKVSSVNNLLSALKDLKGFLEELKVEDITIGKKASVSDPTVLTAKATENTPNVSLKIKVSELSQTELRTTSGGVTNLASYLSATNFTLRYWTSDSQYQDTTINFQGGTLQDLVNTINKAQNKVQASIYFDGNNYKLLLGEKDPGASTKETGLSNNQFVIEITSGNLPVELGSLSNTLQEARNAKLKIGSDAGTEVTSPTNSFKNLLPGLEITANKVSTEFIQVKIDENYDKISKTLGDLLNKINDVNNILQELTKKGSLFQGHATFTQVKGQLFNLTTPLQKLGLLKISEAGQYSLNTETLNKTIAQDFNGLKNAIEDTQRNIKKYLEGLNQTLQLYINTQDKQIKTLSQRIETLTSSLAKEEEKLRLTFTKIEGLMYENNQLKGRLENFMVSLSGDKK